MIFRFVLCVVLFGFCFPVLADSNRVTGYYVRSKNHEEAPKPSEMMQGVENADNAELEKTQDPVDAIWNHYQSLETSEANEPSPDVKANKRPAGMAGILKTYQDKKTNHSPMQTIRVRKGE